MNGKQLLKNSHNVSMSAPNPSTKTKPKILLNSNLNLASKRKKYIFK